MADLEADGWLLLEVALQPEQEPGEIAPAGLSDPRGEVLKCGRPRTTSVGREALCDERPDCQGLLTL